MLFSKIKVVVTINNFNFHPNITNTLLDSCLVLEMGKSIASHTFKQHPIMLT